MPRSVLDVVIDPKGSVQGAGVLGRTIDSIKHNFLDLSAKIFVAQQAITKAWSLAKGGAEFEESMGRLNKQMSVFQSNAHLMVGQMQAISNGQLSVERATTMASRALGIGLDPSQIHTYVQAADALGDVMGTDIPTAFNELMQAATTGRAQVLANIGVFIDLEEESRKLAVSTGRTTAQISRQEKAMIAAKAVTDQMGDALSKLSDSALSDADRMGAVEARWDDLWTTIGQGGKVAVIGALDVFAKLKKAYDDSISEDVIVKWRELKKAFNALIDPEGQALADQFPQNDAAFQGVMGKAITQDAIGNLQRKRDEFVRQMSSKVKTDLPSSIQGAQLDAQNERVSKGREGDLERTRALLEATARLYEDDARQQMLTAEELVQMKGGLIIQELAANAQKLSKDLAQEQAHHKKKVAIGFDTLQEKIGEEERHKGKVFEINDAIKTNTQAFSNATVQIERDNTQARGDAEQKLGEEKIAMWQSQYLIQENLRNQALQDSQVYYQGEYDMAEAFFKSDQEIAMRERQQLREQLAFKLRLTEEEADRLIFFRKAQDFDGVRQIASRADPTLSPRAVEGIVESSVAKDMKAAERANDDFFAGWQRGLQKYSQDRDSAFGITQDMARRTAQAMEAGFQKFFFDVMEGKFTSFKDVMLSVLDFTKQIIAQMVAQLATIALVKGLTAGFGGGIPADSGDFLGVFGSKSAGFAHGGSFTVAGSGGTDSMPVGFMATPGERVTIQTPRQQGMGGSPVSINIAVNVGQGQKSDSSNAPQNFDRLARDLGKMVEAKLIEEKRPGGLLAGV